MEKLDNGYLATLVEKAQNGGSNAFAELYTATYQSEFAYAYELLKDEALAKKALKETYIRALKEINKLGQPELVISWLYHLNFEVCMELDPEESGQELFIDGKKYTLNQLSKNLPMTESQVLIMHYFQKYSKRKIKELLGLDRYTYRESYRVGKVHLGQLLGEA